MTKPSALTEAQWQNHSFPHTTLVVVALAFSLIAKQDANSFYSTVYFSYRNWRVEEVCKALFRQAREQIDKDAYPTLVAC